MLRSPFIAIAEYERLQGIPPNYLNCSMQDQILSIAFSCLDAVRSSVQHAAHKERGKDSNVESSHYCHSIRPLVRTCRTPIMVMLGTVNIVNGKTSVRPRISRLFEYGS